MSSCHSRTPDLGKVMGTEAMEAFGLSDVYCSIYPLGANVAMIDIQSHHPQRYPLSGNILDGQTRRVVGLAYLHVDIPAPLPLPASLSKPGQLLIDLLESSWGWQKGRLVSQPTYLLQ